jgi:hypothetical protein
MLDSNCALYGIWTMYMFIGTLLTAAAVLCDEHQLLWVQPGTIVALILILLIL